MFDYDPTRPVIYRCAYCYCEFTPETRHQGYCSSCCSAADHGWHTDCDCDTCAGSLADALTA